MPISVQCPSCSAKLNAPDAAAGKRVKCPKCQTAVPIPAADPIEAAEVVDEPSPPPPVKRKPEPAADEDDRPKKSSKWEDEEDDRPKKKSRRDDDEDEDDRPKKRSRRDDDEDDEDRPRSRRRGAGGAGGVGAQLNVCGLIGLIVGIPSIFLNFFVCCGGWIPGLIGGLVSLALGIIGLVLAKKSEGKMGGGLAIAGTILGGIATVFSLVWVFLIAAWFGFAASLPTVPTTTGPAFSTGPDGDNEPPVRLTDPADATLTAAAFADEFRLNSATADIKYFGDVVELTGVVDEVWPLDSETRLVLKGQPTYPVNCSFGKNRKAVVAGLNFGMTVTVRGRYDGHTSGKPKLTGCVVVPKAPQGGGGGAAVKVNADDLAKARTEDAAGTDAKYDGQTLEVAGRFERVTDLGPTFPCTVELSGAKGTISFDMKKGQQAQLSTVPTGGLVTIRGRYQRNQGFQFADGELIATAKHPGGADSKLRVLHLALEYAFDKDRPGEADKKYKGKVLEVEGDVRKVNKGGPQGGTLEFDIDGPKMEGRFAAKDSAAFAALMEGDPVKVRGKCAGLVNGVLVLEECVLVK